MQKYIDVNTQVGACTCKMLNFDGSPQIGFNVRRFPSLFYMLWEALLLDRLFPRQFLTRHYSMLDFNPDLLQEVDQPAATFLLVRKKVFNQIGLLDENLPNFYNDIDLCLRIRNAGWKIVYHPGASIYHHGGGSYLLIPKKDAMLKNYRDRFTFVRKHYGLGSLAVLKVVLMIGMIIRMLSFLVIFYLINISVLSLKNVYPANSWEAFRSYKEVLELCLS
jgi:GT2 family glycosyltransferase